MKDGLMADGRLCDECPPSPDRSSMCVCLACVDVWDHVDSLECRLPIS